MNCFSKFATFLGMAFCGTLAAAVPESWINDRVSKSEERLNNTPQGKLLLASINQHGGLKTWFANGPLGFRFAYQPVKGPVRDTYQVVHKWSALARHSNPEDPTASFGWDGKNAWSVGDIGKMNPRFWSLTPYYFLAVPFVFADPGVQLSKPYKQSVKGNQYDAVKVTYESGTGDSPEDYYIVLFDEKSQRVEGVKYIVSYAGFFSDGGHSPEKTMMYTDYVKVDGIALASQMNSFDSKSLKPAANVTISKLDFVKKDAAWFKAPAGAKIQKGF